MAEERDTTESLRDADWAEAFAHDLIAAAREAMAGCFTDEEDDEA